MKRTATSVLIGIILVATLAADVPPPRGYVNDFAGILGTSEENELTSLAEAIERNSSAEVVVVTVGSLEGEAVEEVALRYFEAWGIGKKGQDNGVLILVAPSERKAWVMVGYGLEGVLPDGLVGEIYRHEMVPRFRQGDYAGGLIAAVHRIGGVIAGQDLKYQTKERGKNNLSELAYLVFFFLAIVFVVAARRQRTDLGWWWFLGGLGGSMGRGGSWGAGRGGFGGFGGFGGGMTGGGGAGGSW